MNSEHGTKTKVAIEIAPSTVFAVAIKEKQYMAKAKTASTVPTFTIDKPEKVSKVCAGKIKIPLTRWENLPKVLEELLGKADSAQPKSARGTITLY